MPHITVTDGSFEADVLESSTTKPVLVDFWATWCGPCKMVAPVLEQISDEHADELTVAKVDVDQNPTLAQQYKIMSIPTMILFKDGKPVTTMMGAKNKAAIKRELGLSDAS
jgi:thioredoxin 1